MGPTNYKLPHPPSSPLLPPSSSTPLSPLGLPLPPPQSLILGQTTLASPSHHSLLNDPPQDKQTDKMRFASVLLFSLPLVLASPATYDEPTPSAHHVTLPCAACYGTTTTPVPVPTYPAEEPEKPTTYPLETPEPTYPVETPVVPTYPVETPAEPTYTPPSNATYTPPVAPPTTSIVPPPYPISNDTATPSTTGTSKPISTSSESGSSSTLSAAASTTAPPATGGAAAARFGASAMLGMVLMAGVAAIL